jgi:cysteinyl-tRNA synthetase
LALKIFNTLTRRLEPFIPGGIAKDSIAQYPPVTIYSCGPTVYSYAHIGNFRTFIFNDFLRRYLKFRGYTVNHAMNITDVDDKTIAGALKEGVTLKEYTDKYTRIFFDDCKTLNIEPVEHYPRATESIDAMIDIIAHLDKKGLVYEKDGSLYFSIAKFHKYGRLSNVTSMDIKSGARYDADEYTKEDVRDFALWKAPKENELYWETPFGKGRPGWHIECSAMVRKIFGTTIDIHTGGVDLIFPHHENEIAQSEAAYDEPFVRYWLHVEHLLVEGSKMSKSSGNFFTLRDLLNKGYSPRAIRYLLITAHYRKQLNFTFDGLTQAGQALFRIDNLIARLNDIKQEKPDNEEADKRCSQFIESFIEAVDDDLNIAEGIGTFFDFLHDINTLIDKRMLGKADADTIMHTLNHIDTVFGFIFFHGAVTVNKEEIEALIEERNKARKEKNFTQADSIRDELYSKGIIVQDTREGTRWLIKS